jgi:lathosterol oxidase
MKEWLLRCALSGFFATLLYFVSAGFVARFWNRSVARSVRTHDIKLGLVSLIFGTPVIQTFAYVAEHQHVSRLYTDIAERGWLYWALSLPLYVLAWDLVFYLTHLVLHMPWVYRHSHFRHHACRPPVPWSGIAIDPLETILSGILPYTVPLFFFPFHTITVYVLNIVLMVWATLVHSSLRWEGNAILLSTKDHNLHHAFGLKNANFAAVFTFWDRIAGTLNRVDVAPWWRAESEGNTEAWRPSASPSLARPAIEGSDAE